MNYPKIVNCIFSILWAQTPHHTSNLTFVSLGNTYCCINPFGLMCLNVHNDSENDKNKEPYTPKKMKLALDIFHAEMLNLQQQRSKEAEI